MAVRVQLTWSLPAMRGRKPNRLVLRPDDETDLWQIARSQTLPWFQVQRARIVLARAAGERTKVVADQLECDEATVWRACVRYQVDGVAGLLSDGRKGCSGRQATISPPPTSPDRRVGLLGALPLATGLLPRLTPSRASWLVQAALLSHAFDRRYLERASSVRTHAVGQRLADFRASPPARCQVQWPHQT